MIGYHYTSLENWQRIQVEGLHPYPLRQDIVRDRVPGIWLWTERQRGRSHAGCIWFQIKTKRTFDVVELALTVEDTWLQRSGWNQYVIQHEGRIVHDDGGLIGYYHEAAQAMISWRPIPAERIQLVATYSLDNAWPQTDESITLGLLERSLVAKVTR